MELIVLLLMGNNMILILIALISCTALGVYGSNIRWGILSDIVCPLAVILGFVGLLVYAGAGWYYIAAGHKAELLNKEYGTNYTQADVFYASSVIDLVREIDRMRLTVNGNLIQKD